MTGRVFLVGGGPGDPGLITVRGVECLRQADVVVHDRLVNRSLLAYAPQAEWIDVGKMPDHHPVPQHEINAILVEKASQGQVVVRLKGGDPFVFGRGGEEALALAEAGLPFEIVPGITSAIAAPAYAGIPVTQRGVACSAAIITGHRADCGENPEDGWRRLAGAADTLVFLMGVQNLGRIVEQLMLGGRPPETPVALIEQATCGSQKTVTGTLADITGRAAQIHPPAVIVVGEVVALRDRLAWYERGPARPLLGRRILVAAGAANRRGCEPGELGLRLCSLGAEVVELPPGRMATVDGPLAGIERLARGGGRGEPAYDWLIFTEPEAASVFLERLLAQGGDARCLAGVSLAAAGDETRSALHRAGLSADVTAGFPALVGCLGALDGRTALLLGRGEDAARLAQSLREGGARVETLELFSEETSAAEAGLLEGRLDAAVFTSMAAVRRLAALAAAAQPPASLAQALAQARVVAAGPEAAQEARRFGLRPHTLDGEPGVDDICQALAEQLGP